MKLASFTILLLTSFYVCECHPQPTLNRDVEYSLNQAEEITETEFEQQQTAQQFEESLRRYSSLPSEIELRQKREVQNNSNMPVSAYIGRDNRLHVSVGNGMRIHTDTGCDAAYYTPGKLTANNIQCEIRCEHDGTDYRKVIYCRNKSDLNSNFVVVPIES